MGLWGEKMHAIDYLTFSSRRGEKSITQECGKIADRNGDYKGQIGRIRFTDTVCKNWEEA